LNQNSKLSRWERTSRRLAWLPLILTAPEEIASSSFVFCSSASHPLARKRKVAVSIRYITLGPVLAFPSEWAQFFQGRSRRPESG
jgi:hypothetical protein